jgi:PEP-CTERM motif
LYFKKHACALFFLFLGSTAAFGASYQGATALVTCLPSPTPMPQQPHPMAGIGVINQCDTSTPDGMLVAQAYAHIYWQDPTTPGGYYTDRIVDSVRAYDGYKSGPVVPVRETEAATHISSDFLEQTDGAPRPGYLQVSLTGYPSQWLYNGGSTFSAQLQFGTETTISYVCGSLSCQYRPLWFDQHALIPVTLGTPFREDIDATLTAFGEVNDSLMSISRDLSFQYRFFEADGSTPVGVHQVFDTDPTPAPEPATFAGMGLGLMALAAYGRWKRRQA